MTIKARWVFAGLLILFLGGALLVFVGRYGDRTVHRDMLRVTAIGKEAWRCRDFNDNRQKGNCAYVRRVELRQPNGQSRKVSVKTSCLVYRTSSLKVGDVQPFDLNEHTIFGRTWSTYDQARASRDFCRGSATDRQLSVAISRYEAMFRSDAESCQRGDVSMTGMPCSQMSTREYPSHYYDRILSRSPAPDHLPFPTTGTVEWAVEDRPGNIRTPHAPVDPSTVGDLVIRDETRSPEHKVIRLRQIDARTGRRGHYTTVFLRSGETLRLAMKDGMTYAVAASAGSRWYGSGVNFDDAGVAVDLGTIRIGHGRPAVMVLGSTEQAAKPIPNGSF